MSATRESYKGNGAWRLAGEENLCHAPIVRSTGVDEAEAFMRTNPLYDARPFMIGRTGRRGVMPP
jgi:hypothetical protein